MQDLERAYNTLAAKHAPYSTLFDYYEGRHPLVYSTDKLCEVFKGLNARFRQNWCAVVIDATADRINLSHLAIAGNEAVEKVLGTLWDDTELELDEEDIHRATLVCGEAFVVAGLDDAGEVEAYYNDPRQVHVFYDPAHPRRMAFAAKWWVGETGKRHITLFYEDRYEYYISRGKYENVSNWKSFVSDEEAGGMAEHAFGRIPVFHFRRERTHVVSELASVIDLQDAINKLLSDMMVAAEFGAFRQRYIITDEEIQGQLRNAPNQIWGLPGGSSVGEFSSAELGNYLEAIDKLATSIGIITRTPKHYFYGQGGDPSGEALIALEAPLNKKVERYVERFKVTWQQVAAFLLQLKGESVAAGDIEPAYSDPQTVQPLTQSLIRQNKRNAGIPLVTILRDEGWTKKELDQLTEDLAGEPKPPAPIMPAVPTPEQGDEEE